MAAVQVRRAGAQVSEAEGALRRGVESWLAVAAKSDGDEVSLAVAFEALSSCWAMSSE